MPTAVFEGLTFSVNGVRIAPEMRFKVHGICSLFIAQDDFVENCIRLYFTQRHTPGLSVDGRIVVDGAAIPADRLHLLTNQFRLFNCHESVHDVLHFVDAARAPLVLREFDAAFSKTPIGVLSIEESRIFEVLLSVVASPPFIFLSSLEISSRARCLCLRLLRDLAADSAVLVLSGHDDAFDGTILVLDGAVHSLGRRDGRRLHREDFLSKLLLHAPQGQGPGTAPYEARGEPAPYDRLRTALQAFLDGRRRARDFRALCSGARRRAVRSTGAARPRTVPDYDYRALYRRYKCENLLDMENRTYSLLGRFFVYDIYRASLVQCAKIAVRKYALMLCDRRSTNMYRNLNPFIVFVAVLRIVQEVRLRDVAEDAPGLLCLAAELVCGFPHLLPQAGGFLFLRYIIRQPTPRRAGHILYNVFRRDCNYPEFQCVSAMVYLAVFYDNAAIFEEECGFIRFYTNRIMTPATYVLAVYLYLCITHVTVFCALGLVFRIRCIAGTVASAVSLNMLFACSSTRRLREIVIGIFLTLYVSSLLVSLSDTQARYFNMLSCALFPPILWKQHYFSGQSHCVSTLYVLLFQLLVFVCCCHRISRFGHIS